MKIGVARAILLCHTQATPLFNIVIIKLTGSYLRIVKFYNVVISSANELQIMVTSNISTSEVVCPGNIVVFTCTTRGSAVISWTGDDYVGDQIGFNAANMIGDKRQGSANPNTIATLINNTLDGTPVLVSQLQINVLTVSSNQSVVCIHNSDGIRETVTFQVLIGIRIHTHKFQ